MINWEQHSDRISSVHLQFRLARKALASFGDTPEAIEKYIEGELESLRQMVSEVQEKHPELLKGNSNWVFTAEATEGFPEVIKGTIPEGLSALENRINQNELIMYLTLFEIFMKDFHREVLRQKPELLRADRQIPLGKLTALGEQQVIEEEIEREIQSLDRKSVEDRARYFRERLGIGWQDGTILPLLKGVLDLRNKILHQDPDARVEEDDIALARLVCHSIPWACVAQAAVLYPGGFKMIEGLDPEKAKSLLKK